MTEYIERKALREAFENADADVAEEYEDGTCDWGFGHQNILEVINSVPAADVEPVVRCKECKHAYINSFSAASGVALCTLLTKRTEGIQIVMQQDDFCSYGERKDGDGNG